MKIFKLIWRFIFLMPLTTYGILGFLSIIIAELQNDYSQAIDIMILFLPVMILYAKICDFIPNITLSTTYDVILTYPLVLIVLIIADFFILLLRKKSLKTFLRKKSDNEI